MIRVQNPVLWAQHFYERMTGEKIWNHVLLKRLGEEKPITRAHWIRVRRGQEVPIHIAEQVERLCGGAIVVADMCGAYVRTRTVFDNECQFMAQIREEEIGSG